MLWYWLVVLLGYLIGSIPSGYLVGRFTAGRDIRRMGDANIGAGNVYRTLGYKWGVGVYFMDLAKGILSTIIALLIGQWFNLPQTTAQILVFVTGAAAVIGHNWPVFLGFRGGRGESTTIGVLYVVNPIPMLILTAPTVLTLYLFRKVILTSAFLFILLPILSWVMSIKGIVHVSGAVIAYGIALPCLVGFTHFIRTRRQPAIKSGHLDS